MTTAVVFAYHDVGARCLRVLLAHGVDVALVVTHADDPGENIWFECVADVSRSYGIETIAPQHPNDEATVARIAHCAPDFLFSFYYRAMLGPSLLAMAPRGPLNMHGSLLPKYRGRAPVNWAILNGERCTGATLHYMTEKPDAGDIVAQQAVPILPDDAAIDVFRKVTVAAEIALDRVLPSLIDGTASRRAQNLAEGSYFGARKADDGRIDWSRTAREIHDLVRAVAPPYPGAFTTINGAAARVLSTRVIEAAIAAGAAPRVDVRDDRIIAHCGGGGALDIRALEIDGSLASAQSLKTRWGDTPLVPGP